MMPNDKLLIDFYTEISSDFSETNRNNFNCTIALNVTHPVYKGHFEQVPIAPGVCLVQIIKEILMDKFNLNLILFEGSNIKFLALINPTEINTFNIDFTVNTADGIYDVSASYTANGVVYTKFKGKLKKGL